MNKPNKSQVLMTLALGVVAAGLGGCTSTNSHTAADMSADNEPAKCAGDKCSMDGHKCGGAKCAAEKKGNTEAKCAGGKCGSEKK